MHTHFHKSAFSLSRSLSFLSLSLSLSLSSLSLSLSPSSLSLSRSLSFLSLFPLSLSSLSRSLLCLLAYFLSLALTVFLALSPSYSLVRMQRCSTSASQHMCILFVCCSYAFFLYVCVLNGVAGVLDSMERDECADLIKSYGGKVTGGVSGKTNYLIAGHDAGECVCVCVCECVFGHVCVCQHVRACVCVG